MSLTPSGSAPLLVRWYGVLAVLASLGAVQALVLPRWPRVENLATTPIEQALKRAGFTNTSLALLPPSRSYELASSSVPGFGLAEGRELRLVRASVRERKNMQIAFIGRDRPELALKTRQLQEGPPPTASGRVGNQAALQTCLVPGVQGPEAFGVTWLELPLAVDRLAVGPQATARRILGLQQNRAYECVLISLRSTDGTAIPLPIWRRLLHTLQPALQSDEQGTHKP